MKKRILLPVVISVSILALIALIFLFLILAKQNFVGEKEFTVNKGETVDKIINHLAEQKIIKSKLAFKIYLYLRGWQRDIQAGSYVLTPMSTVELAKIFAAGKVDNEMNLKFIEGWTMEEMADYLVKQKLITNKDNFLEIAKVNNFKEDYQFLAGSTMEKLEGFLFPDTYRVYRDAPVEDIIRKMLDNFGNKFTPSFLTEITAQKKSLSDILIMASILEREVPKEEDRKMVAGILWKRLAAKMPLQVDASLKYIIGSRHDAALTYEELKIDSPYNTYKYRGLPPTPICNPGESAIRAAIYPKNSDYWYYLSTEEGETIFSKTLDEHNAAIRKYLK